jgi:hypothetical protein
MKAIPHAAGIPFNAFLSDPYSSWALSVTLGLRHGAFLLKGHPYTAFSPIYF